MLAAAQDFVLSHPLGCGALGAVLALFAYLLLRGEQRIPRNFTKCPEPPEESQEDEDRAARRRFTPNRLAKALPPGGVYDAVVVGSGPSGMCCAASLARLGAKVCVLEQGEELGGGAHVFALKGYEFETGVHYLGTDEGMNNMLSFATHGRIQIAPIGTPLGDGRVCYDEVRVGEDVYHFTAGIQNFQRMLDERFPGEQDKIQRFCDQVEHFRSKKYKNSAVMFFRLKAADFLPARLKAFLAKLLSGTFFSSTQETAEQLLRRIGIDPDSRLGAVVLGQYSDAGVRPDKLSAALYLGVVAHYIEGSTYPIGGSGAIPRKMNGVVRAAGGESFVQARVTELLMSSNGRCRGVKVGNTEIRARCVVNSIGALPSYEMLRPHFPRACDAAIQRLKSTEEMSVAFIFLFIALDTTDQPEEERDDSSHNRWLYAGPGFTAAEKRVEAAQEPWSVPCPMFVASGSAKDGGWSARYGRHKKTIVVLSQCPWHWVSQWAGLSPKQRDKDAGYQAFKQLTEQTLMRDGFRQVFPQLEKYIVFSEVGTPLTTNNFLGKREGECYGRAAIPRHWGCQDLHPFTPCPNYYLTGQDVGTLGLAGSLASGYTTANVVAGFGSLGAALRADELCFAAGEPAIYKTQ